MFNYIVFELDETAENGKERKRKGIDEELGKCRDDGMMRYD